MESYANNAADYTPKFAPFLGMAGIAFAVSQIALPIPEE